MNALIREYMIYNHYHHSLSVFEAESAAPVSGAFAASERASAAATLGIDLQNETEQV